MQDLVTHIESPNKKRVAFIITATETYTREIPWLDEDRNALRQVGFEVTDYTVTDKTQEQIQQELSLYDIIAVSGGNTFYLLQQLQKTHSLHVLVDLVFKHNKIYIGTSAGSCIATPNIYVIRNLDDPEDAPELLGFDALGLVDFIVLPHWGSEKFKQVYVQDQMAITYNINNQVILLTDLQYVRVDDRGFYRIEDVT